MEISTEWARNLGYDEYFLRGVTNPYDQGTKEHEAYENGRRQAAKDSASLLAHYAVK